MVSLQALALVWALSGGGETVLLDFYSDSCGPCRQVAPVVSQLAAAGYPVRKVNVDRERELAARFGVNRIPCFVMLADGKEVDRLLGATTYDRLEAMCKLAMARRAAQPAQPTQPSLSPGVQLASNTSGAPVLPVPAVHSAPAFSASPPSTATADATMPGWRMTDPSARPAADSQGPSDATLIAATVRLRIEDPSGQSCGTGTIIDARQGEALVLTCGHLFRDSKGKGRIEADLFGPNAARAVSGQLIGYDLDRDVALLSIRTPGPVTVARVAPPGYQAKKGDLVTTVGCNNGDDPTVRHSRVTSLDKFVGPKNVPSTGLPTNVQVAGLPVQGRSGGGLFSSEGYVIGVCNAADPTDNEGLFAALACIYAQLDDAKLASIYQPTGAASSGTLAAAGPPPMPKQMPQPDNLVQLTDASSRAPATVPGPPAAADMAAAGLQQPLSPQEQATLEEIRRRKAEGAEVILIIRPRSNPEARSEIITLDKASPTFVEQLTADQRAHVQRQLTSLEIPADAPVAAPPRQSNWQPNWLSPTIRK